MTRKSKLFPTKRVRLSSFNGHGTVRRDQNDWTWDSKGIVLNGKWRLYSQGRSQLNFVLFFGYGVNHKALYKR